MNHAIVSRERVIQNFVLNRNAKKAHVTFKKKRNVKKALPSNEINDNICERRSYSSLSQSDFDEKKSKHMKNALYETNMVLTETIVPSPTLLSPIENNNEKNRFEKADITLEKMVTYDKIEKEMTFSKQTMKKKVDHHKQVRPYSSLENVTQGPKSIEEIIAKSKDIDLSLFSHPNVPVISDYSNNKKTESMKIKGAKNTSEHLSSPSAPMRVQDKSADNCTTRATFEENEPWMINEYKSLDSKNSKKLKQQKMAFLFPENDNENCDSCDSWEDGFLTHSSSVSRTLNEHTTVEKIKTETFGPLDKAPVDNSTKKKLSKDKTKRKPKKSEKKSATEERSEKPNSIAKSSTKSSKKIIKCKQNNVDTNSSHKPELLPEKPIVQDKKNMQNKTNGTYIGGTKTNGSVGQKTSTFVPKNKTPLCRTLNSDNLSTPAQTTSLPTSEQAEMINIIEALSPKRTNMAGETTPRGSICYKTILHGLVENPEPKMSLPNKPLIENPMIKSTPLHFSPTKNVHIADSSSESFDSCQVSSPLSLSLNQTNQNFHTLDNVENNVKPRNSPRAIKHQDPIHPVKGLFLPHEMDDGENLQNSKKTDEIQKRKKDLTFEELTSILGDIDLVQAVESVTFLRKQTESKNTSFNGEIDDEKLGIDVIDVDVDFDDDGEEDDDDREVSLLSNSNTKFMDSKIRNMKTVVMEDNPFSQWKGHVDDSLISPPPKHVIDRVNLVLKLTKTENNQKKFNEVDGRINKFNKMHSMVLSPNILSPAQSIHDLNELRVDYKEMETEQPTSTFNIQTGSKVQICDSESSNEDQDDSLNRMNSLFNISFKDVQKHKKNSMVFTKRKFSHTVPNDTNMLLHSRTLSNTSALSSLSPKNSKTSKTEYQQQFFERNIPTPVIQSEQTISILQNNTKEKSRLDLTIVKKEDSRKDYEEWEHDYNKSKELATRTISRARAKSKHKIKISARQPYERQFSLFFYDFHEMFFGSFVQRCNKTFDFSQRIKRDIIEGDLHSELALLGSSLILQSFGKIEMYKFFHMFSNILDLREYYRAKGMNQALEDFKRKIFLIKPLDVKAEALYTLKLATSLNSQFILEESQSFNGFNILFVWGKNLGNYMTNVAKMVESYSKNALNHQTKNPKNIPANTIDNYQNLETFTVNKDKQLFQFVDITLLMFFQRVSALPNSTPLVNKALLAKSITKFDDPALMFVPATFVLPQDYSQLVDYDSFIRMQINSSLLSTNNLNLQNNTKLVYILKKLGSSRGNEITIVPDLAREQLTQSNYIIQRYICNPWLIKGRKFDFRVYFMITSLFPLKVYIYKDGFVRFCSEPYSDEDFTNIYAHLTNTAIQRDHPNGIKSPPFIDNGNTAAKCSFKEFQDILKILNVSKDTNLFSSSQKIHWDDLWKKIKSVILRAVLVNLPALKKGLGNFLTKYKKRFNQFNKYIEEIKEEITSEVPFAKISSSKFPISNHTKFPFSDTFFEIFGADILFDNNLDPWLLEINTGPSLAIDCYIDEMIKARLLVDSFKIVEPPWYSRQNLLDVFSDILKKNQSFSAQRLDQLFQTIFQKPVNQIFCSDDSQLDLGNYEVLFPSQEGKRVDKVIKKAQKKKKLSMLKTGLEEITI
eukprot:TRINITY_DN1679_c0_g1_i1.p1 TRINITY_DN1679_c0_g1~~TRINITY_DN1679_c0_g1_i1.p1  ORF type:complete len:1614 (-),score=441.89 TRINITY_DN1679_c0_g1_i1:5-4846(-)